MLHKKKQRKIPEDESRDIFGTIPDGRTHFETSPVFMILSQKTVAGAETVLNV